MKTLRDLDSLDELPDERPDDAKQWLESLYVEFDALTEHPDVEGTVAEELAEDAMMKMESAHAVLKDDDEE